MNRVNSILSNPLYIKTLKEIEIQEKSRNYCKHNLQHFLDVSRIAYIKVLEQGLDIDKEIVYATGLLHDLGRIEQYLTEIPHNIAALALILEILQSALFKKEEVDIIVEAIINHNSDNNSNKFNLMFYHADKESRLCVFCGSSMDCKVLAKNIFIGS